MVLYSAFTDPDLFWGRIASNPTFEPGRDDAPWKLNAVTIVGGTHAADSPNSYRLAMTWLFNRNES